MSQMDIGFYIRLLLRPLPGFICNHKYLQGQGTYSLVLTLLRALVTGFYI